MEESNGSGSKVVPPPDFDGSQGKTLSFLMCCGNVFTLNPKVYDTIEKKMCYALSYMKGGTVAPWAEDVMLMMENDDPNVPKMWAAFKKLCMEKFQEKESR